MVYGRAAARRHRSWQKKMLLGKLFLLVPLFLTSGALYSSAQLTFLNPITLPAAAASVTPATFSFRAFVTNTSKAPTSSGVPVPHTASAPKKAIDRASDIIHAPASAKLPPATRISSSDIVDDLSTTRSLGPDRASNPAKVSSPAAGPDRSGPVPVRIRTDPVNVPSSIKLPAPTKPLSPPRASSATRGPAPDRVRSLRRFFARDASKSLARDPEVNRASNVSRSPVKYPLPANSLVTDASAHKVPNPRSLARDAVTSISLAPDASADTAPNPIRELARGPDRVQNAAKARTPVRISAFQRTSSNGRALRQAATQMPYKEVPEDALSLVLRIPRMSWDWWPGVVAVVDLGDGERWLRVLHYKSLSPVVLWRAKPVTTWSSAPLWLEHQNSYVFAATNRWRMLDFLLQDIKEVGSYYSSGGALMMYNISFKENAPIVVSLWDEHLREYQKRPDQINPATYEILLTLKKMGAYFRVLVIEENPPITIKILPDWIDGEVHLSDDTDTSTLSLVNEIALEGLRNTRGMEVPTLYPHVPLFQVIKIRGVVCVFGAYLRHINSIEEHFNMSFVSDPELVDYIHYQIPNQDLLSKTIYEEYLAKGEIVIFPVYSAPTIVEKIILGTYIMDTALIIVPLPGPLPAWSLPLRVFGGAIWTALLGTMLAYALAWRVVARESLLASLAAAMRAFSSCGGPAQDRVSATPQRLQLASVLLTSAVIVASAYQGRLFSLVTDPETYPHMDTFEDLEKNGIHVSCHLGMCITIRKMVAEKSIKIEEIDVDEHEIVLRRGDPYALPIDTSSWPAWRTSQISSQKVHIMKDNFGTYVLTWTARRGWPWADAVSLTTLYLDAGGIREFWMTNYTEEFRALLSYITIHEDKTRSKHLENAPKVLQMRDFASPFIVLLLGLLSATFALVVEVRLSLKEAFCRLFKRLRRRKKEGAACTVPLPPHASSPASARDVSPRPQPPPCPLPCPGRPEAPATISCDTVVDTGIKILTGSAAEQLAEPDVDSEAVPISHHFVG